MSATKVHRLLYGTWVRLYSADLYRYAYRLTGRHAAADDLIQDTFAEAWRSIDTLRDPLRARAWLFQILRHRFARYLDRNRRQAAGPLPESDELQPTSRQVDPATAMADRDAVGDALARLSPDLARTFLMVFSENLTCQETAEQLGIPLGTVLSRLDRARRALRLAIDPTMHRRSAPRSPPVATLPHPAGLDL